MINEIVFYKCKQLFDDLSKINYVYTKGELTSFYVYSEFGRRKIGDIDILIDPNDIDEVKNILIKNGFCQPRNRICELFELKYSHQLMPFYKQILNDIILQVDVNINIFWGEYNNGIQYLKYFLNNYCCITIYNVLVKCMEINYFFIYLCLNIYKDLNSIYLLYENRVINKSKLHELFLLFENDNVMIEKLFTIANNCLCQKYIMYMALCLNEIYKSIKLDKLIEIFNSYYDEGLYKSYGLEEGERKLWKIPFKKRYESIDLRKIILADLNERDLKKIKLNEIVYGKKRSI